MRKYLLIPLGALAFGTAMADCGGGGTCCQEPAGPYICRAVGVGLVSTYTSTTTLGAGFTPGDASVFVSATTVLPPSSCTLISGGGARVSRVDASYDQFLALLTTAKIAGGQVDISFTGASASAPCTIASVTIR
jgi:hypothetical protein